MIDIPVLCLWFLCRKTTMGDEWENGDIPSVTQSSACGHTAVVRMYFLLLLYISDTLASQWHGQHALPDACACKMAYHCRSGMIEFIFVILFFVVCKAKSCRDYFLWVSTIKGSWKSSVSWASWLVPKNKVPFVNLNHDWGFAIYQLIQHQWHCCECSCLVSDDKLLKWLKGCLILLWSVIITLIYNYSV